MSSITIAAPAGDSTYSYSRTTFGSSSEASTAGLSPEQLRELRIGQQLTAQVLDRHRSADASCRASTTSPNPPEPSVLTSV